MPVLSPHRNSVSGSYRPAIYSSSALDRPYFSSSSYSPRVNSYSERYTTRSYTDSDGRRVFARSGSVTEDGVTTRFREESREGSLRRDSQSRDGGISSIRENSVYDYPSRRDSSLSRNDRLSSLNVIDSVAELRNKYSPANYVPACLRKNDNISRSKSINDIGLPPIEKPSTTSANKKKVNDIFSNSNNSNHSVSASNVCNTNLTKTTTVLDSGDDDNGNRASVADLCRKFDEKSPSPPKVSPPNKSTPSKTETKVILNGKAKPLEKKSPPKVSSALTTNKNKQTDSSDVLLTEKVPKRCQNGVLQSKFEVNKDERNGEEKEDSAAKEVSSGRSSAPARNANGSASRVNHFASYIPTKDYQKRSLENGDEVASKDVGMENGSKENSPGKVVVANNDLSCSTSPKPSVRSSALSPSNSTSDYTNSGASRRSSERDRELGYRPTNNSSGYSDEETSGATIRGHASTVKTLGLNGLKNIGNTCFMNSVIQCLSNTRVLLEYLRRDAYVKDINTTTSSMKGALIKAFAEVIKELWSEDSSDRVVNTVSLKSQIQRFAPRFIGYAQQDAQEFLRYLLEGLHEDVNRVTERPKPIITEIDDSLSESERSAEAWRRYLRMDNSKIVDYFVGQLKSTLKCTYCGHCSMTFDPFWDLSLPIPQRTGQLRLSQCLDSFTREETMDGDEKPTCSKCKERRKCTKSFTIQKFPKILVIHLKRFSPTERFRGKLNVSIDFPLEGLDMSNYSASDNVAPCRYNLYAVSNHSGTTYSGHYTAYCRHPYNGGWHEYNDSRVSSVSSKSIVSGEAYVLFYEQEGTKSHL